MGLPGLRIDRAALIERHRQLRRHRGGVLPRVALGEGRSEVAVEIADDIDLRQQLPPDDIDVVARRELGERSRDHIRVVADGEGLRLVAGRRQDRSLARHDQPPRRMADGAGIISPAVLQIPFGGDALRRRLRQ